MPNPYSIGSSKVPPIDQTANLGELVWNVYLGGERDTEFSRTDSGQVWRITWPYMLRRILSSDPVTVPDELAHWIRGITNGVMPFEVAEQLSPWIADWLNSNSAYLQYERNNPQG